MTEIAIPQWMIIETHITQKVSPATCSELPSISLHELAIVYKEMPPRSQTAIRVIDWYNCAVYGG